MKEFPHIINFIHRAITVYSICQLGLNNYAKKTHKEITTFSLSTSHRYNMNKKLRDGISVGPVTLRSRIYSSYFIEHKSSWGSFLWISVKIPIVKQPTQSRKSISYLNKQRKTNCPYVITIRFEWKWAGDRGII